MTTIHNTIHNAAAPDSTDRWAFVLAHEPMIQRLCRKYAGALSSDDRQDFVHNVLTRVAERFEDYDSTRSSPVTWITWQIRAVQTDRVRSYHKRVREGYGQEAVMVSVAIEPDQHGSAEHFGRHVAQATSPRVIRAAMKMATDLERIAIETYLAGMPATELRRRHRMTGRERMEHLRAVGARMEAA